MLSKRALHANNKLISVISSQQNFSSNIKKKYSGIIRMNCEVKQYPIWGLLLFLKYVNDMNKAEDCDLFLSIDFSCLVYQHKDVKAI